MPAIWPASHFSLIGRFLSLARFCPVRQARWQRTDRLRVSGALWLSFEASTRQGPRMSPAGLFLVQVEMVAQAERNDSPPCWEQATDVQESAMPPSRVGRSRLSGLRSCY